MTSIKIHVPASSANLGTGYDALGVALSLCNTFELELNGDGFSFESESLITDEMRAICGKMCEVCANHFFQRANAQPQGVSFRMENRVPIARGLGSSATLRIAIMEGLNRLMNFGVSAAHIVQWAAELEGCTDNAAAAYYGGFTASGVINGRLRCYKAEVPEIIDFVAVSPHAEVETDKARVIFSKDVPREDAVHNLTHGILLSMAFAQGEWDAVGDLMDDRLHQPQRQANIPALKPLYDVINAAREAGALGAYLSGSGSTMMAMTLRNKEQVAAAMQAAVAKHGLEYETRFLKADNHGLRVA